MDWSAIVEAASLVFALLGAVISLWVRSTVDQRVARALEKQEADLIVPLRRQVERNKDEIAKLHGMCTAAATRDDVHKVSLQVERALGQMQALTISNNDMKEELKATRASVQRVNDYLLNEKV